MGGVLIVNPYATRVTEELIASVEAELPAGLTTLRTHAQGDATSLAREVSRDADAIYVFSGDGTFNEVLNGVDGTIPVGFIPGGGTSVLPRALGLSRDPIAAAAAVARGRTRRISLGRVDERRFGFSAGIGLDAEIVRRVNALGRRPDGRRPGDSAFARAGLKTLAGHRFHLSPALELAGIGRASFVMAANCDPYTYAGRVGLRFAPNATFEGGLDLVAPERLRFLPLLGWWALGRGGSHVRGRDVDRIEIRCDRPLPLQLDGEDLGDVESLTLEAERDAVTVLV
jgi:diacylglycerol kinase family enzyme